MKVKAQEPKVRPQMKLSEEFLDLRTADTNIIIEHLEENIKLRELSVDEQFRKMLKRK